MKATQALHDLGQSIWLDNITRDLLESGTLARYIDELSVTGLTSNPTIFDHAIKGSSDYDAAIRSKLKAGRSGEALFFELALSDITRAADLFRPVYQRTDGVDGWVSLEVSPLLANDTKSTIAVARDLHARAGRPNLFIKIPGTPEGIPAIEEAIFAGVPVNVTLLFSAAHYVAAAEAWLRGIERRIEAGLSPFVASVASLFISRWDRAVVSQLPQEMHNTLGIGKSYLGIWLAHTGFGLPFAIYLLRSYMAGLPRELMESSRIDGASDFEIFMKIVLPLSFPVLASFAIFQFLWVWNDLLVAMVFLGSGAEQLVLTGKLNALLGSRGGDWEILTTSAFITIIVPLIVFFSLQRYFVRGLLAGSVKGG